MVHGQVFPQAKRNAVELLGSIENAFGENVVQLKIGLQLGFVEGVFLRPELLGIKRPVPRCQLKFAAFRIDHRLQGSRFHPGVGNSNRRQRCKTCIDRLCRFGRLVVQAESRVIGIPQQRGSLGPQLHNVGDDLPIIVLTARRATPD